jgi:predicted transcriptional regulator
MSKALILSVRPQHAYNILNGEKTLELRKSVPKGFKGWVYVYVTKGKPILWDIEDVSGIDFYGQRYLIRDENLTMSDLIYTGKKLNGTIPFRFWFDDYSFMEFFEDDFVIDGAYDYNQLFQDGVHPKDMCLTNKELEQYGKGKPLYAWHIKNLDIFPKPMQLSDFAKPRKSMKQENKYWIHKAPQSYMYAWVKEEGK